MTRWTLVAALLAAVSFAGCNCGAEVPLASDTGLPVDGSGGPDDAASAPEPDGSIAFADGGMPQADGALPEFDGGLGEFDGAVPEADGSVPEADASASEADGSLAATDGSLVEVDAGLPAPDASAAAADAASPGIDASAPGTDASLPPDAAAPGLDASTNHPPTVTLPDSFVVVEGQTLEMTASFSDPDEDTLAWSWTQVSGMPSVTLSGTSTPAASFLAPTVAADSVIEIRATACDPGALCASATAKVTIDNAPTISSAIASPSPVDEGQGCTLTATAVDPGDTLTYAWSQTSGPIVTLSGGANPIATFTAPLVSGDVDLGFSVEVCDAYDACATRAVSVTVNDLDGPPVAKATATPNPASPAAIVTLDASASTDPEGKALTFEWTQTAGTTVGLADPNTAKATFVAPLLQDDTVLSFQVKVCDAAVQCTTATVDVAVLGHDAYVSATGSDAAPTQCTKAKPCKTIPVAQGNAVAYGYSVVRVDAGDYPGAFDMVDGVAVECGYDRAAGWTRPGTLSRIVTSNATGIRFPSKVNARLDGCTVTYKLPPMGLSTFATVTVEAATAQLVNCTIDATDPSSAIFATSTTGVGVVGPGANVTVTGGSIGGGNGMNLAVGVGVAGASAVVVDAATVTGSPKGAPKDSYALRVTDGAVTASGATILPGIGVFSATGLWATGANTTVTVSKCTVGGGQAQQWTGIRMNGIKTGTVSASSVTGGTVVTSSGGGWAQGIRVEGAGAYTVDSNERIVGGAGQDGAIGVFSLGAALQVSSNTLIGGGSQGNQIDGIRIAGGSATISKNAQIEGGPAGSVATGIRVNSGSSAITDNAAIVGSLAAASGLAPAAYGIYLPPPGSSGGASGVIVTGNKDVAGGFARDLAVGLQMSMISRMTISGNGLRGGQAQAAWALRDGAPDGSVTGASTLLTIDANVMTPAGSVGGPVASPTETGGAYFGSSSGSVTNNRIFAGPGATSYGVYGRGDLAFFHNYVRGGGAPGSLSTTYAMFLVAGVKAGRFDNNIFDTGRLASTRYGVYEQDGIAGFTPVEFFNNDFFPDPGKVLYHLSSPPAQDKYTAAEINSISTEYKGNLDVDPLFKDAAAGDYHLQPTSPCIDKGFTSAAGPVTDMDGDPRPLVSPGLVDIGPDEAK